RDLVGVHDRGAVLPQQSGDRRLARTDPAREPHQPPHCDGCYKAKRHSPCSSPSQRVPKVGANGQTDEPLRGQAPKETNHMNLFVLRTWLEAKFAKDEKGASMVEYILLVALIALAVIAAVVFLKDQVNGKFNDAGSKLSSAGS